MMDLPALEVTPTDIAEKWVSSIRARLREHNKNWLCVITGDTGQGKSYGGIRLAQAVSGPNWTPEGRVFFTAEGLLERLQSGTLNKGDVLIFDEAGVGMSSREWQSKHNRAMGYILQTFRYLNIGIIFTVPNISFVDVIGRKLFHHRVSMRERKGRTGNGVVYKIRHSRNPQKEQIWFIHPQITVNDVTYKLKYVRFTEVDSATAKAYERMSQEYKKEVQQKAKEQLMSDAPKQETLDMSEVRL